jgi:hypothetical protein
MWSKRTAAKIKRITIIIKAIKTIIEEKTHDDLFIQFGPTMTYFVEKSRSPFHYIKRVLVCKEFQLSYKN